MKMKLQTKLIGAFLILGGMVVIVGAIGKLSSDRLSQYVHNLSEDSLQSVHGLWQVNEGQTQIQSGERLLFDVNSTDAERQTALNQIKDAWVQIDDGFKRYEKTPSDTEEESLYKQMQQDWAAWKKSHEEFMRLEDEFHQQNMRNPWKTEADLLRKGKNNSPAMAQVQKAIALRLRMKNEGSRVEEPLFNKADKEAAVLLDYNVKVAEQTKHKAEQEVAQTNVFVFLGVILGSSTALFFGIFFSITIAKPLAGKIAATVNAIVSSSSEIAATIEQQERTAQEQATAVNQTTTTMDELGASSRQSTEQAEASATGAQQVLALVDGRSQNGQSNHSSLREQVGEIADQILRLSEQTNQIGTISTLVGDLANQTNMLALNAAVEAVRAGEHGKGFGVVASEIRKLADQSKKSAERISTLVIDIQNATSSTVMATDEGTKAVSKIVDAINAIAVNSQQISLTAKQQAIAIQQVVAAMNAINQGASQTAAGISQTKVGTHKLNEAATQLKAIV